MMRQRELTTIFEVSLPHALKQMISIGGQTWKYLKYLCLARAATGEQPKRSTAQSACFHPGQLEAQ